MTLNPQTPPIDADDKSLRRHLSDAEVPALLMTIAHLTGDTSFLREDARSNGWLLRPQGGMSPEAQEEARATALAALARFRDDGSPVPPPPSRDLLRRISAWVLGRDVEELLPLIAEEIVPSGADPKAPDWRLDTAAPDREVGVAVIGAGMSGLLAAHRLSQAGVPVTVYEKNTDVGGTWFENTYPGCRVDVASHLYNYSFARTHDWPDHFCVQEEVLEYFREVAREYGLYESIRFGTEVAAADWDEAASVWRLTLRTPEGEETAEYRTLVSAVGQLNRPSLPDVPGLNSFAGDSFHSATWDHGVKLAGKRVAVIGTGASAFQIVPEIAETTGELLVFQRTAPWLRPTPHYHDAVPDGLAWLLRHVPYYAQWYRLWLFAPGLLEEGGILQGWIVDEAYPPTERAVSALNDGLRAALTEAMTAQVSDSPELLRHVIPDYPVGAKRVFRDDGRWFATLKRDDVSLVTETITEITPRGIVTADGTEHDVDAVVYATGFEASRFLAPMRVTGRGGLDLHEHWNGEPRAYLGLTIPGFPNLFCLYGPNTNLVGQGGSIFYFSECGVTYLLDAVRLLLEGGHRAVEVRKDVHDSYNAWVDEANELRSWGWTKASTWYRSGNRSAPNWPFSALEYWHRTRRVVREEYTLD
ncbi:flavin-containing monooxygenase [Nocardiopsis nanhaiensis]